MTGIERLYKLSEDVGYKSLWDLLLSGREDDWDCEEHDGKTLDATLTAIAEQIKREHAEDCFRMGVRAAEDREAAAWVREHGGLDEVKAEWNRRSNLKRQLEKAQAKVERQQRHIEFVQGKCRERQGHIVELSKELAELRKVLSDYRDALGGMCERLGITDGTSLPEMPDVICEALDRRLMPEGYEWPRYEGGPLLRYGASYIGNDGGNHRAWQIRFDSNADVHVSRSEDGDGFDRTTWDHFNKGERVKRPAVLASDGEPLEVGQTVWGTASGDEYKVKGFSRLIGEPCVVVERNGIENRLFASQLTHTKPEQQNARFGPRTVAAFHREISGGDSWERIEEDTRKDAHEYCEDADLMAAYMGREAEVHAMASDLVRRCRALAEREREDHRWQMS